MNHFPTLFDALWLASQKRRNAAKVQWDKLPQDLRSKMIAYCTHLNQTTEDFNVGAKVVLDTMYGPFELSEYNLLSIKNNLSILLGL